MLLPVGLLLAGLALMGAWTLDEYVARRRDRCTDMLGMMVGMVAGMMTGLVIGEVAGFFTNMFWSNLLALTLAVPLGGYLGRHGRLLGILDGAMAGVMGGMMGAMLGVMLQFSAEYALATGVLLVIAQFLALASVAYLVERGAEAVSTGPADLATAQLPLSSPLRDYYGALGVTPDATRREVAAAYLGLTDGAAPARSAEQQGLLDEALAVLSDSICRAAYDRARAATTLTPGTLQPKAPVERAHQPEAPAERAIQASTPPPKRSDAASDAGRSRAAGWGAGAIIVFAVVAFGLVGARSATASCPPPAVADGLPVLAATSPAATTAAGPSGGVAATLVEGKQVVNLTIQYPCYYPNRVTVQRGMPVQLNVGAVGEPGCGRQVLVRGLRINGIVPPGRVATFEFTPEEPGTYSINCGMSMMRPATLQVIE